VSPPHPEPGLDPDRRPVAFSRRGLRALIILLLAVVGLLALAVALW
jgi:hypothetical protein